MKPDSTRPGGYEARLGYPNARFMPESPTDPPQPAAAPSGLPEPPPVGAQSESICVHCLKDLVAHHHRNLRCPNGRRTVYCEKPPEPPPVGARIQQLETALTKIDAIRNSIIGRQTVNWSAHIYPLVAALEEAGFKGEGYEVARANALAERKKLISDMGLAPAADPLADAGKMIPADVLRGLRDKLILEIDEAHNQTYARIAALFDAALAGEEKL